MGKSEEALKTDDVDLIKRCRSSMATQITSDLALIDKQLVKKVGDSYDIASINDQVIQSKKKHLSDHFDMILKLHERYTELRPEGVTEAEEESLTQSDVDYIGKIETKVYDAKEKINQYEGIFSQIQDFIFDWV